MRLCARNLSDVTFYARVCVTDALGAVNEGFAETGVSARAGVEYVNNTLNQNANFMVSQPFGARAADSVRMRVNSSVTVNTGDKAVIDGLSGAFRVTGTQKFRFHTVLRAERIEA